MAVMASAATTIYIDKSSVGNIWAWDSDGNYFQEWPGVALSTLDVATVDGVEYYTFVYTHESSGEGLISISCKVAYFGVQLFLFIGLSRERYPLS